MGCGQARAEEEGELACSFLETNLNVLSSLADRECEKNSCVEGKRDCSDARKLEEKER